MTEMRGNPYRPPMNAGSIPTTEKPTFSPWQSALQTFGGCLFCPAFLIVVATATHNSCVSQNRESPFPRFVINVLDADRDGVLNIHGDPFVLVLHIAGPLGFALCCGILSFYFQRVRLRREANSQHGLDC